jgi:hypothetical protein
MLSLPELTSAADAIVVAAPDGPPEPLQNLRLVVRRVVKGDLGLTTLVTAWPDDVALPAQPVDFYGLWFLSSSSGRATGGASFLQFPARGRRRTCS